MDSGMLARRSVLKQGMAMIAIVLLSVSGDDAMGGGPAHGPSWREVADVYKRQVSLCEH